MLKEFSKYFEEKDRTMLDGHRKILDVLKQCGRAMRLIHAARLDDAERELKAAWQTLQEVPRVWYLKKSIIHAEQELVEAQQLWNIEKGIGPQPLEEVSAEGFVLGMLDLGTELKRNCLEALRQGKDGEKYFKLMEEIYEESLELVFPSQVLPEFRVKQDRLRYILETCREMMVRNNVR